MTRILAYPRPDGQMAVRNHLFVLPAVVCANQVAIDVARDIPGVKYVEHQHGCAQIGADLAQTQRVFSHLAAHPNAFATMLVGLGCEGVVTKDLYEQTRLRTTKPLAVILIQEAGGTPGARAEVAAWAAREQARAAQAVRTAADWPA
ncbi:UxaA family hydrolase, partial [Alicyclobacillus cellulosilyticus]|uniref:UxaA family hydrolase n=1 Tax=Alicyclobacillus cellulosilyticus TaxID=1003997 RepID=UPI001664434B